MIHLSALLNNMNIDHHSQPVYELVIIGTPALWDQAWLAEFARFYWLPPEGRKGWLAGCLDWRARQITEVPPTKNGRITRGRHGARTKIHDSPFHFKDIILVNKLSSSMVCSRWQCSTWVSSRLVLVSFLNWICRLDDLHRPLEVINPEPIIIQPLTCQQPHNQRGLGSDHHPCFAIDCDPNIVMH